MNQKDLSSLRALQNCEFPCKFNYIPYIELHSLSYFRSIRHHTFSDNSKDKLRIQIYPIQSNQGNAIYKRDLPLDSIVSREKFIISSIHRESESNSELSEFSTTFAHGNNLNSIMGVSNAPSKTRTIERKNIGKHFHLI